jgi:Holliday junction resolvase RusA-like endonuclease
LTEPDVQLALIAEAAPLKVSRETFCVFELAGEPRAWERARARIARNREGQQYIHFYVGFEEMQMRNALGYCAKAALRGKPMTERPVAVLIHAFMPIAASWSAREKIDARNGAKLHTGTPDADNLGKMVGDALNEIVWKDDGQIADLRVIKRYSDMPALRVEVREFCQSV